MKVYILTDEQYHDNEGYYGAYSTREKAEDAIKAFVVDPTNNWEPSRILEFEVDAPARVNAETIL